MKNNVFKQLKGLNLSLIFIPLILVFNSWFIYINAEKVQSFTNWVTHTNSVLIELAELMSGVKDAETGVRGFLLTKDQSHLETYKDGTVKVWQHYNQVSHLTGDNATQQESLKLLKSMVEHRLNILEENLEVYRKYKSNADTSSFPFRKGTISMDMLRAQIDKMKSQEQVLLAERSESVERAQFFFLIALALTTLLSLIAVCIAFMMVRRNQLRILLESESKTQENWVRENSVELAKLLTGANSLKKTSQLILDFLATKLKVLAANFYVAEDSDLKRVASFGIPIGEQSNSVDRIANGETLLSQMFLKDEATVVENVPDSYLTVSSSLGSSNPKNILFLPIAFQDKKIGIFELAFFESLSKQSSVLVDNIREVIGMGVNSAQWRESLQNLLEKTQQQTEELQAQQEELRTNNEELEQQARALDTQQQILQSKNSELEKTREQVEEKAKALELSSQYKSEFLAKMSHELRTPLNSLLILTTLLIENKEKNLTEQQREFAKSIHGAGKDLLSLINDILDLSKIEAHKLALKPDFFNLNALLEQLKKTFHYEAESKKLKLDIECSEEVAALSLYSDWHRIEQILRNFISNALKFTEEGSIKMKSWIPENKKSIVIAIQDTGIGIPENKKEMVFEAFEQADSSVSRKYGGTGLGLTICRELAILLGGKITLESKEGLGSTFILEIPQHLDVSQNSVSSAPNQVRASIETSKTSETASEWEIEKRAQAVIADVKEEDKTILIVEDDSTFRYSLAEVAEKYGFSPIQVDHGEVALEVLKLHTPSAVLLDIKLPGISGMGLLEIIKQMPHLRHVPIHVISGVENQKDVLRMGAIGFLKKPVGFDKIGTALSKIENLISKKVKRLLVIEDDERQQEALKQLLGGTDLEIVFSKTGKNAAERIKKQNFDCIILDLTLPDMTGFDLLKDLNSIDMLLPPIIVYTGRDLSPMEESYLRQYSESIIIKGARSPERLLDDVNLFLHRVESLLPEDKREILEQMRSQDKTFEGKTVLIVDDDLRNVFALTSALEGKGLNIRIARNGLEAIEAVERHDDINLILMDIMMPKMDGYQAMKEIRSRQKFKGLPIIALTAKTMKEDHEKCIEAGANDYLSKPINLNNLMSVLRVWISHHHHNRRDLFETL